MPNEVRLDTAYFAENWKHYSKIIFKCVNSTVGSIFNFFFLNKVVVDLVNSALCNSFAWIVRVTVHGRSKKNNPNAEARRKTQTHTFSIYLDMNYLYLRFEFCVFLFFSFFGTRFGRQISLLRLLFMNRSCTIWLFSHILAHQ